MRNFNDWLGKMRPSINGYGYYVDDVFYAERKKHRRMLNVKC